MKVVADAGPLIAFAKLGRLDFLVTTFPQLLVPPAVFAEAVTAGIALEASDAKRLELLFQGGSIRVAPTSAHNLEMSARLDSS